MSDSAAVEVFQRTCDAAELDILSRVPPTHDDAAAPG